MNKEEIEHKLEQAKVDKFEINKQVQILEKQLREAEEPKRRHGDFGINKGGFGRIMIANNANVDVRRAANENGLLENLDEEWKSEDGIVFGNIFDLMKDWGKDLEEWESKPAYQDAIQIIMEVKFNGIFFGNSGNAATFDLESITEIWCKLGQGIATLKKKSPQE